jgi:hypothetical protein
MQRKPEDILVNLLNKATNIANKLYNSSELCFGHIILALMDAN